jgi:lipopolysaccharide export system protein LptA
MPLTMLLNRSIAPLLWLCLLALSVPAHAERADRDKPMNIEADALRHEDAQQVTLITGNVLITKGTITMRGQQAVVRQAPDGSQHSTLTAAPGARAFFRQKREGVDEWIEGEGESIVYDSQTDTVTFQGRAVLRRLRGAQLNDETMGQTIVYSGQTEIFTVEGQARTADNPSGRVRAMLTPVPKPGAAPAAAPAAPAALKPSERMKDATR